MVRISLRSVKPRRTVLFSLNHGGRRLGWNPLAIRPLHKIDGRSLHLLAFPLLGEDQSLASASHLTVLAKSGKPLRVKPLSTTPSSTHDASLGVHNLPQHVGEGLLRLSDRISLRRGCHVYPLMKEEENNPCRILGRCDYTKNQNGVKQKI